MKGVKRPPMVVLPDEALVQGSRKPAPAPAPRKKKAKAATRKKP